MEAMATGTGDSEPLLETQDDGKMENVKKISVMKVIHTICQNPGLVWCLLAGLGQAAQIVVLGEVANLVSPMAAMFVRSSFLFVFFIFVSWKLSEDYDWYDMFYNFSFAFLDVLGLSLSAVAMRLTPTSDVSAIFYNLPIPTSVLACLLLGEAFDVIDGTLAVINGIGLVLICKASVDNSDTSTNGSSAFGILLSFVSLLSFSAVALMARVLAHKKRQDPSLLLVMVGFNGVFWPSVYLSVTSSWSFPETSHDQLVCLTLGTVSAFGAYAYTKALKTENAFTVAVSLTLCIPLTYFYDVFFNGRVIVWQTVMGVCFTIGTTVCLYFKTYVTTG